MEILLPLLTLIAGAALTEFTSVLRSRRERAAARQDRYERFIADVLAEALLAMDEAYEAASAIGLNADLLGVPGGANGSPGPEHWKVREPYVTACGLASFRLRRSAVQLPSGESPRMEIEALAQPVADLTGQATVKELLARFKIVDNAMLPAREAVAQRVQALYEVPAKRTKELTAGDDNTMNRGTD